MRKLFTQLHNLFITLCDFFFHITGVGAGQCGGARVHSRLKLVRWGLRVKTIIPSLFFTHPNGDLALEMIFPVAMICHVVINEYIIGNKDVKIVV